MTEHICLTCGTQFAATAAPPPGCPVCDDSRQYVGEGGQAWTTMERLSRGHDNVFRRLEPGLAGIGTVPSFAIGQRALLIRTGSTNMLWDCVSLLDATTIEVVTALGGIGAIAISHPHYYASMVDWARTFGAPIHLHTADREWVMRQDDSIHFWDGDQLEVASGLTLIRAGGHFPGGTVLHWAQGAEGRGALLSGDIIQVVPDGRSVSFMYSYPNLIPLSPGAVEQIVAAVQPYPLDRIYGAWWNRVIEHDGKAAVERSAERYLAYVRDTRVLDQSSERIESRP